MTDDETKLDSWLIERAEQGVATARLAAPRRWAAALPESRGDLSERQALCAARYVDARSVATDTIYASPQARGRVLSELVDDDPELGLCAAAGFLSGTPARTVAALLRTHPRLFAGPDVPADLRLASDYVTSYRIGRMRFSREPLPDPKEHVQLRGGVLDVEEWGAPRTRGITDLLWIVSGVGKFEGPVDEVYQWRKDRGDGVLFRVVREAEDSPFPHESATALLVRPALRELPSEFSNASRRIMGLPRVFRSQPAGRDLMAEYLSTAVYAPGVRHHVVLDGLDAFRNPGINAWLSTVAPPHRRFVVTDDDAATARWRRLRPDEARFVTTPDQIRPGVAPLAMRKVPWQPSPSPLQAGRRSARR